MHAVVLAAGASSRFWPLNSTHKSLVSVCGARLIEHTLDGLREAGITDIVIVEGPEHDISAVIDADDVTFITQPEPEGMGNALQCARSEVSGEFIVTGPYRYDIKTLASKLMDSGGTYDAAVLGCSTSHPERYGILTIDGDTATGLVEKPAPKEAPSETKIISTYLLEETFFGYLDAVDDHEYSFEDALDTYMAEQRVRFVRHDDGVRSLKYPWDLFGVASDILDAQEPRIADDAEIADSATIDGAVTIGTGTQIYENAVIRGPCYIGEHCAIGNNTVVRAGSVIEDGVTIGANAEVRHCLFQERVSCHSGFFGDSIIGPDVSIGAGTVTANRLRRDADGDRPEVSVQVPVKEAHIETGLDRLGVIVGRETDIGTQTNLMPGVCIGQDAFVGPSTLLRRNVPDGKTVYSRMDREER